MYRQLVDRIPACTGQGMCVSQNALGRGVSVREVFDWGGLSAQGGDCLGGVYRGVWQTPPCEQNDWKTGVKTLRAAGGNKTVWSSFCG